MSDRAPSDKQLNYYKRMVMTYVDQKQRHFWFNPADMRSLSIVSQRLTAFQKIERESDEQVKRDSAIIARKQIRKLKDQERDRVMNSSYDDGEEC